MSSSNHQLLGEMLVFVGILEFVSVFFATAPFKRDLEKNHGLAVAISIRFSSEFTATTYFQGKHQAKQ